MDSDLETSGFYITDELCDDMGGDSTEDGMLHKHDLQPTQSFTETRATYATVTHSSFILCAQHKQAWWTEHSELVIGSVSSKT